MAGFAAAGTSPAYAAQAGVGLGTASSFAVLAGSTVTNTGPSVISGDLGVSPGSAVTGFPPGLVTNGSLHAADARALRAQSDLTTGYEDAAGRTPATDVTGQNLGGLTLFSGVYADSSAMALTGTVTLDAQGDPAAVFIFQAGSTLTTASNSTVALINGASPCNVFWQVGSSATLRTGTTFVGTVMALTSATLETRASVQGRVLARNGAVTLDTNRVTAPDCSSPVVPPPDAASGTPSVTPTPGGTPSGTPSGTPTGTPAGTPSGTPTAGPTGSGSGADTGAGSGGGSGPGFGSGSAANGGGAGGGGGAAAGGGPTVPQGHPETGLGGAATTAKHSR
jgi:hypothetical protein